jgi:hypothetical protein
MMKKKVMTTIVVPTSCTQERTKESKTVRGNTKKQTQAKTKSKITRGCNNDEKVCSFEEELDDNRYYFCLLHIREERREEDHKGGNTKKQNANQN